MATAQKQSVRAIFKVGGFLAFIMLGYLGIRSYRLSVEKLKTNKCIEEIAELVRNIQEGYRTSHSYKGFDYNKAVELRLIPRSMFREGFKEAVNSYIGGIDFYHSSLHAIGDDRAFEISFQGLSSYACENLMLLPWSSDQNEMFIAIAGYATPTASGVLDEVLSTTEAQDIHNSHIFRSADIRLVNINKIKNICACKENICSVIWKFY